MTEYPKPNLTADAVVLSGHGESMRLLVIRREKPPFMGSWAFPGGFVDPFELPLSAAIRECEEETGIRLSLVDAIPLTIRVHKGRDPRGWTVTQPYLFWVENADNPKAMDDAADAGWQKLDRLNQMAFDHGAILCEALGKFWPMMPTFDYRLNGIEPWGGFPHDYQNLVFFGGSFNPWHEGHGACLSSFPGKGILIIVPDRNPEKDLAHIPCFWKVFQHISQASISHGTYVFPGFFGLERRNPTIRWLPHVKARSRGLLLGADSFVGLRRWIQASKLVKSLDQIFVVPRNVRQEEIFASEKWLADQNPACTVVLLPEHPFQHLSSSQLRQKGKPPF